MIRRVVVSGFKKFRHLEFEPEKRVVIAGPNNSGKSTLLQALATWAELGEIWLRSNMDLEHQDYRSLHPVEVDVAHLRTLALPGFDQLWHNQDTGDPITIKVKTDDWSMGFDLTYQDATVATVEPVADISTPHLQAFAENPLTALYIPSLSGLDIREPEYSEGVVAGRLAHGKGGTVLRNMVQAASRDSEKWTTLQSTVKSFFDLELSVPSGDDPIAARYRHSARDHWYDLLNGSAGFLQTVLVQSALLHSNATLFLIDEPDAHLHALLKAKMYRLIREHCDENSSQVLIATHSGRLIEEAANEKGEKLFLVTAGDLRPVRRQDAEHLLTIPNEEIVLAETTQRVLYLEGKTDIDILRAWAKALDHPALQYLDTGFWVSTAEEKGRVYAKKHYRALKAQVPALRALEVCDRNGTQGEYWDGLGLGELRIEKGRRSTPEGMKVVYWTRYETENYLIHPNAILRFISRLLGKDAEESAREYMEGYLPRVLFEKPFETTDTDQIKGKTTISRILTAAGVELGESDYFELATVMSPNEIHPDVVAMLNEIESQFADQEDHEYRETLSMRKRLVTRQDHFGPEGLT